MLKNDRSSTEEDMTTLWIIIPSRWIKKWLIFAHMKLGEEPGRIDTKILLVQDKKAFNGWRPLMTLKPPNADRVTDVKAPETPGHYRLVYIFYYQISHLK